MGDERELISKKALLEKYGVSYGSLYRWKRKGLIPDEWFVRKATVTGQETYFPKDLICERVELILSAKDDVLLDELSARLKGETQDNATISVETPYGVRTYRSEDIRRVTIVDPSGAEKDVTKAILNLLHGRNE